MHVRIVRTVHHLAVREHYTLGIFNFNFVVAQLFADVVRLFLFSLVGLHQRIEEPLSLASLFILLFRSQARGVALNLLKVWDYRHFGGGGLVASILALEFVLRWELVRVKLPRHCVDAFDNWSGHNVLGVLALESVLSKFLPLIKNITNLLLSSWTLLIWLLRVCVSSNEGIAGTLILNDFLNFLQLWGDQLLKRTWFDHRLFLCLLVLGLEYLQKGGSCWLESCRDFFLVRLLFISIRLLTFMVPKIDPCRLQFQHHVGIDLLKRFEVDLFVAYSFFAALGLRVRLRIAFQLVQVILNWTLLSDLVVAPRSERDQLFRATRLHIRLMSPERRHV